jgi:hypothetical protein
MQELTNQGDLAVQTLAQRYGVSTDAVKTLLHAVSAGGGKMAQFYHPELGGGGQWMQGGMTMVGDMFNHGLQALVSNLCGELSGLLSAQQVFTPVPMPAPANGSYIVPGNRWWPAELGIPSSSGGQSSTRYAYFPRLERLAVNRGGKVSVYDTQDHHIGGVQQQPGGLSFSSQRGTFMVESLPVVNGTRAKQEPAAATGSNATGAHSQDMILSTIDRLADMHQRGILSDEEFRVKKAELLGRL